MKLLIKVNIWDLRVGEVTQTLVGPRITGDAIDFREDLILTGSNRVVDQLQLWDYRTKQILHTFSWDEKGKVAIILFRPRIPFLTLANSVLTLKILSLRLVGGK
jgi:WD40 repeat protein